MLILALSQLLQELKPIFSLIMPHTMPTIFSQKLLILRENGYKFYKANL